MRVIGSILVVIGIVMIIIRGCNVPVKENVAKIGPVEINKTENKWLGWPSYAGAVLIGAGIIFIVTGKRNKS